MIKWVLSSFHLTFGPPPLYNATSPCRYGWSPPNLPLKCECDHAFTVDHALSCAKGGFPSIRHNEIRDITATLLTEVCNDVCVESDLQPVAPNQLHGSSANIQDGARLDIAANGVWGGRLERTYFDVRVSIPLHHPTGIYPHLLLIESMNGRIKGLMNNVSVKLNILHSLHLCYLLLAVWALKPRFFTSVLPAFWQGSGIHTTAGLCVGCVVV